MSHSLFRSLIALISIVLLLPGLAQAQPRVGRDAAAKYFGKAPQEPQEEQRYVAQESSYGGGLLSLQIGGFVNSAAYEWGGNGKKDKVGKASYGVTYLFDRWSGVDVNIRGDFNEYKLGNERAVKLSLMPLWTLPMADSNFPLYFGLGTGLGVYFKQLDDESNISFDYQLVAGVRVKNIFESVGFVIEFGLKNHLHILSDGQFNGTALTAGTVFSF